MTIAANGGAQLIGDLVILDRRSCAALGPALEALIRSRQLPPTAALAASIIAKLGRQFIGSTAVKPSEPGLELDYVEITTIRAAQLLGCQVRNIRDLADRGRLPGRKVGRRWSFRLEAVLNYRERRTD